MNYHVFIYFLETYHHDGPMNFFPPLANVPFLYNYPICSHLSCIFHPLIPVEKCRVQQTYLLAFYYVNIEKC